MGPFEGQYYRAKILGVELRERGREPTVRLFFIDFGNEANLPVRELRMIPEELLLFPPFALEAILTGVSPSLIHNPRGIWHKDAVTWFKNQVLDQHSAAKVLLFIIYLFTLCHLYCVHLEH